MKTGYIWVKHLINVTCPTKGLHDLSSALRVYNTRFDTKTKDYNLKLLKGRRLIGVLHWIKYRRNKVNIHGQYTQEECCTHFELNFHETLSTETCRQKTTKIGAISMSALVTQRNSNKVCSQRTGNNKLQCYSNMNEHYIAGCVKARIYQRISLCRIAHLSTDEDRESFEGNCAKNKRSLTI